MNKAPRKPGKKDPDETVKITPEEIAKFSNAYLGTDKLEFGKDVPSFMESLDTITK